LPFRKATIPLSGEGIGIHTTFLDADGRLYERSWSEITTAVGGAGPRLPAPGIRSRATSMLAEAGHRQARPGIRR
jgi:hypothetical protein